MGYYMAGGDLPGLSTYTGAAKWLADAIGSPTSGGSVLPPGPAHAAALRRIQAQASQPWLGGLDPNPQGRRRPAMNAANPAAMRRAMRRVQSFARAASKMINFKPRHARSSSRRAFPKRKR